jgi:hypothetical protein
MNGMKKKHREQLKQIARPMNNFPIRCRCGGVCFIMDEAEQEKSQEIKMFERKNNIVAYAMCGKCGKVHALMKLG